MKVKIIAYNSVGYRKEIAILSEKQIHTTYGNTADVYLESINKNFCSGIGIFPKDFPEVVKFDIIIEKDESR